MGIASPVPCTVTSGPIGQAGRRTREKDFCLLRLLRFCVMAGRKSIVSLRSIIPLSVHIDYKRHAAVIGTPANIEGSFHVNLSYPTPPVRLAREVKIFSIGPFRPGTALRIAESCRAQTVSDDTPKQTRMR